MYLKSVPMKAERFVYDAYRDFIVDVGAPVATSSNLAELIGGKGKYALVKLFHYTPQAPYEYWCYGLEFLVLVRIHLSRQGLKNKTSHQALFGDTKDISIFRFPWFCPVWFYAPTLDFPVDRMKPGSFLGIATNSNVAPTFRREEGTFTFVDEDGIELPDDDKSEDDLFSTYTTTEVDMIEMEDPESDFNQLQHDNPNPLLPLADPDNDGELDDFDVDDTPPLVLNASSDSEYSSDEDDDDDDDKEDNNNNDANPTEAPPDAPASPVVPSEETQVIGPTVIPTTNWYNETGPSYITQDENDVPEDEVEDDPIELESSDKMCDDIAEHLNIANDPNMPETEEIIS
ncbi:hypothetical protein CTEN210_17723 [Chaetoceros tenuissimus]|uniref:Uncharacterized protein n=1 Tax=Chaetoceros tenuissimus TaxID=426638 RepID=A0AAD3HES7_9STRA|nr:hypothetical protein CTEN210_17723 [Chaetoceros tenuissimus]